MNRQYDPLHDMQIACYCIAQVLSQCLLIQNGTVLVERGWSVNRIPGRQVKATRSSSNEFLSLKCISKFISFCSAYYWCKFSDLNFLKISKINVRTMKIINDGDWTVPSISFFNDTAIRYFHTI